MSCIVITEGKSLQTSFISMEDMIVVMKWANKVLQDFTSNRVYAFSTGNEYFHRDNSIVLNNLLCCCDVSNIVFFEIDRVFVVTRVNRGCSIRLTIFDRTRRLVVIQGNNRFPSLEHAGLC